MIKWNLRLRIKEGNACAGQIYFDGLYDEPLDAKELELLSNLHPHSEVTETAISIT